MATFHLTQYIEAPPRKVFELASDFASAPDYINGIARVEMLTDGPVGVGTRFRETRVMFKREATEEMEITGFDPPRSYTLGCQSCGCRYTSRFEFLPRDNGTQVKMRFDAEPLTFMAKVLSVILRPMMKACVKACAKDLDDLRRAAEGDGTGGEAEGRLQTA